MAGVAGKGFGVKMAWICQKVARLGGAPSARKLTFSLDRFYEGRSELNPVSAP